MEIQEMVKDEHSVVLKTMESIGMLLKTKNLKEHIVMEMWEKKCWKVQVRE